MSGSKHFEKIAGAVTAIILIVTILFMNGSSFGLAVMNHTMGYENRLFDNTKLHTIDIEMDNWDEFIANATSEEYYTADLMIDDEAYKNVAIREKGNTSLTMVSSMDSERYSFKVEFDHYDNAVTYHGLDKLSLNNLIQDSTMMKDYLTYTMMREFGVAAPLCSFVYITVNGEDWGLYLAVEGVEDSFLERNYGSDYGELYKPDSMSFGGGRGNGKDFNMDDFMKREESAAASEQGTAKQEGGIFDLSAIFGGETPETGNSEPAQTTEVVAGEMPEMGNSEPSQVPAGFAGGKPEMGNFDPSQMPEGFGGEMPDMTEGEGSENKERGGKGGFGGFGMGSSDVKLQYVDDELSSYSNIWNNAKTDITEADQTRLIESLQKLSNGEQIESVVDIEQVIRYFVVHNYVCNGDSYTGGMIHNYYLYEENGQLAMIPWDYNLAFGTFQSSNAQSTVNTPIDAPVSGGAGQDRPMWNWILSDESYTELYHQYFAEFLSTVDVQTIINNAYSLIKPYVEKDPTAFYTVEEFETGVETMHQFCTLRSESISMQLANGETVNNMNYVDASALNLSDMGSMGGKGGFGGGMPNKDSSKENFGGQMPDMGEMPEGFDSSKVPVTFSDGFSEQVSDETEILSLENKVLEGNSNRSFRDNMPMQGGGFHPDINTMDNTATSGTNWIWFAGSVLLLGAGLLVVKLYKH